MYHLGEIFQHLAGMMAYLDGSTLALALKQPSQEKMCLHNLFVNEVKRKLLLHLQSLAITTDMPHLLVLSEL